MASSMLAEKAAIHAHRYMRRHPVLFHIYGTLYRNYCLAKRLPLGAGTGWAPDLCSYKLESGRIIVGCTRCGNHEIFPRSVSEEEFGHILYHD